LEFSAKVSALAGQELIVTAHKSLGYKTPSTPLSPLDDSIRAAWRSSTQTCLDIPDLCSSASPTLSPGSKKRRMQSAPDILGFKTSPPTPPPSSPVRQLEPSAGKRMRRAMDLRSDVDSDKEGVNGGNGAMFPGTPVSSPVRRILASPIRQRGATGIGPDHEPRVGVLRTPVSSPLAPARIVAIPLPMDTKVLPFEPGDDGKSKNRKLRPLSLRSRLKLAARRIVAVK
jgi:hypothetical protein